MEIWEGPTDIFGMAMYYSITKNMEKFPKYRDFINNLTLNLVLELDYYPVMIKFEQDSFEITREIENPDAIVKIGVQDLMKILDKKTGMLRLLLKRKLKFRKGFTKIFKIYKVFSKMVS